MTNKRTLNYYRGVGLVLLTSLIHGFLPLVVTNVYSGGGNPYLVIFGGSIVAGVALLGICLSRHISLRISKSQHLSCLLLSAAMVATSVLLFSSYSLIPTGMATTLHFMYPAAVLLLMLFLFRQHPTKQEIISLVFCIVGVFLLSNSENGSINLTGVIIALLSGLCYALYFVIVDRSSAANLHPFLYSLYLFAYNSLFAGILCFAIGAFSPLNPSGILWLIVHGFMEIIAIASLQKGIVVVGATVASVLSVFEPLVSVIVGVLLLSEAITARSVAGTVCVLIAAVLAALR